MCAWLPILAAQVFGQVAPASSPEEIIIKGKVTGPPLWQVKSGDNTLWIFAYLTPLPEDLEFDTSPIERVIAGADEFLQRPDLEMTEALGPFKMLGLYRQYRRMRVNPDEQMLENVLPADLYERLLAAKNLYGPRGKGMFKLRPLFAALELNQAVRRKAGFTDASAIGKSINRLVKRYKVPSTELVVESDLSYRALLDEVAAVSHAAEVACLTTTIEKIETDIDGMKNRAQAWAYGQINTIYAMDFPDQQADCAAGLLEGPQLGNLFAEFEQLWLAHAERALAGNRSTFAIIEMQAVLAKGGVLAQLEDKGYEVIAP